MGNIPILVYARTKTFQFEAKNRYSSKGEIRGKNKLAKRIGRRGKHGLCALEGWGGGLCDSSKRA